MEPSGGEGQCVDDCLVTLQAKDLLAGGDVPEVDNLVLARRGDGFPIGREGQASKHARLAADGP